MGEVAGERGEAGERDDDQRGGHGAAEPESEPEREHGDDDESAADAEEAGEQPDDRAGGQERA